MYLKNPDWDMDIPAGQCAAPSLLAAERGIIAKRRTNMLHAMWSEAIDGEYLDVRIEAERAVLYVERAERETVGIVEAQLPDGEYRLVFSGGYPEDFSDEFAPWAECSKENRRGAVVVMLLATVTEQRATFRVLPRMPDVAGGWVLR